MLRSLEIHSHGQGLHEITNAVSRAVHDSAIDEGLCTLFLRHTSASLLVQENADPSARRDLEAWLSRLVEEGDPLFTHTQEGADDMPAHIRSALLPNSLSIPVSGGRLQLGAWQGIYLWEHRRAAQLRSLVVHVV